MRAGLAVGVASEVVPLAGSCGEDDRCGSVAGGWGYTSEDC